MFYLNEFLKIFKRNTFVALSFCLINILLFFTIVNFNSLQKSLSKRLPQIENEHYFNSLVSSTVNVKAIERKIKGLPGVKRTSLISKKEAHQNLKKLEGSLGLDALELQELKKMVTLKVVLDEKVSESSINLIREYLKRLVGVEKILLGAVKKKISKEKMFKHLVANVKKWPLQVGIAITVIFWMISLTALRKQVMTSAYLIESYQRKSKVAMKISFAGIACLSILALAVSSIFFIPNWYAVAMFSILSIGVVTFSSRKRSWVKS